MTVRLVIAPAGGGKTAHAIDAIRALPPLSPVRVLVPDQIQAIAFRRRLARTGGALGVQVQTFYGLYADVLMLAGGSLSLPQALPEQGMARLPGTVRLRLIQHLVETLCDAGRLPYYAPLRHSPGFAHLLAGLFGELKRARVFPEDLERVLSLLPLQEEALSSAPFRVGGRPRLAELARLYAAYQDWLLDTGWVDADGQGWLAAIALEQNPSLLSDLSLFVDGFDEFNPTQLHLLRLLAGRASACTVTLAGDLQNPGRLAHRRLVRARTALEAMLDIELVPLADQIASKGTRAPPLVHLEASLFEPNARLTSAAGTVAFVEARNRAAEARQALRWLKARRVRDGVPLSDLAVIARDVAPYRPFLKEVAAEFGVPLHFVAGAALRENPALAALLSLLALPLEPDAWSPRVLLDALTSRYLNWAGCGLMPGDPALLHQVARAGQVIAGLDQWREAFLRQAAQETAIPDYDEGDRAPGSLLTGAQVARLEAVFEDIVVRIMPPARATLRERVMWMEDLVGDDPALVREGAYLDGEASLRVVACARENPATAERDAAALHAFKDILSALVLADSVLAHGRDADLAYEQFVVDLVQAVEETAFAIPVEGEAILVASALGARGLTFDAVALLGLAEGDFPRAEREDPLLREPDRAWLAERDFPVASRLQGDEATFFYQAVTRARRRLLICRPYLADDGQSWEASPYWAASLALFDDAPVIRIRPTDPVTDVASAQELANALPGDAVDDVIAVLRARSRGGASLWNGELGSVQDRLAERFAPDRPWSSSRLEAYAKCPFYFWTAYAMELEPRELPQIGFDVLVLGSIYHLVLERLYRRVADGDPERLRAELSVVAQEVYDAAPNDYGFRPTPLWERQQEELTRVLRRTVDALIDVAGAYRPLIQELPFGLDDHPALVVRGDPPLHLRGYVDRVDRTPDGRLRIIDYKAGSTPISARDLSDGHRLQLPLYALAAEQALEVKVASGFYWHIGSAEPSRLKLEGYGGGIKRAIETAVDHALAIAAAVRAGQFVPAPPDGGCPTFCPAAVFCDRYVPRSW